MIIKHEKTASSYPNQDRDRSIDRSITQLLEVDISPVVVECNHSRQLCWQPKKNNWTKLYKCMYVGRRRRERGNKRDRDTRVGEKKSSNTTTITTTTRPHESSAQDSSFFLFLFFFLHTWVWVCLFVCCLCVRCKCGVES
jgi:hypothetical protein